MAREFSADELASLEAELGIEAQQDPVSGQWRAQSFDGPGFLGASREEACRKALDDALANEADWHTHVDPETADYLELTED